MSASTAICIGLLVMNTIVVYNADNINDEWTNEFIRMVLYSASLYCPRFIILLCFFLTLILIFFISTSQKVVLEEHLRYDLFSVEWDVKP